MAKVYIKFNAAVIKEVKIEKDEMTFGRKSTNDIVIDHPTISGFHGRIKKDGHKFIIEDLNSTNGTYIKGQKIKSAQLKDGDQIGVAGHILEFHLDDAALAPSSTAPLSPAEKGSTGESMEAQKEMLRQQLGIGQGQASQPSESQQKPSSLPQVPAGTGVVRIVSGSVNGQVEVYLKDLVTYIGTTDQAAIKIKGFLVPSLAAAISKRPEGYFLKAVKPGYPKVNGSPINEQVFLENGALIEVGGTNMVFYQSGKRSS